MSIATCSPSTGTSSPRAEDWRQGKSVGERNLYFFHHRKDLMDLKFLVGAEKQEIMAHSNILIVQSAEFDRILPPTRDKNEPIEFPQYDPKSFELLLEAIYVGELPETDGDEIDFIELLKLVRSFKPELESLCKSRVVEDIKEWKVALKALELELEDLEIKEAASEVICQNSDDVLKSAEFLNLPINSLKEILKLDGLDVGETKIFKALIRWAENKSHQSENRSLSKEERLKNEIGDIIHLIRFPLMPQQYFLKEVASLKILSDAETGKISTCMICLSHSTDCDHREKCCDPFPFSCNQRRRNSERTISSSTPNSERSTSTLAEGSGTETAIPIIAIDDSDSDSEGEETMELEDMLIPKSERRRSGSAESAEEPERKILKVSGNEGPSIARQIEDNSLDTPNHEDANQATNEATSVNALMDEVESAGSSETNDSISSGSTTEVMTAIKVIPGRNTFIKENSWMHILQTESSEEKLWFGALYQDENFIFLKQGFTLNVYAIQPAPTNEVLKLKFAVVGDRRLPNHLPIIMDIWYPPADSVNQPAIFFTLHGTTLSACDFQDGQKIIEDMDLAFPSGNTHYSNLEIVDEFICIECFYRRRPITSQSESSQENDNNSSEEEHENNWVQKESVQELLILKLSHSPTAVVELRYRIIIPAEALREDFLKLKRRKRKLFVKTPTKVEIFDMLDLINAPDKKIIQGEEHDAATFNKHPNLKTIIFQKMPNPQYEFDSIDGIDPIPSKTSPLHVLTKDVQKFSIYNVEHPEKAVRTISYWTRRDKVIFTTCIVNFDATTYPYLMCHYESSGFILIKANEPGPITNTVLKTSHIFPMEKKSSKKRKRLNHTPVDQAKKEMRWPNWRFEFSVDHKGKIGICSIDLDNKIIYVSIHDMEDLKKNIEKLPPLKIEEWGIPEESVKQMDLSVDLNEDFVKVSYWKKKDRQTFVFCRMRGQY